VPSSPQTHLSPLPRAIIHFRISQIDIYILTPIYTQTLPRSNASEARTLPSPHYFRTDQYIISAIGPGYDSRLILLICSPKSRCLPEKGRERNTERERDERTRIIRCLADPLSLFAVIPAVRFLVFFLPTVGRVRDIVAALDVVIRGNM